MAEDKKLLKNFAQALTKLGDELTASNIRKLTALYPDIGPSEAERIRESKDPGGMLFESLKESGTISFTDVDSVIEDLHLLRLRKAAGILELYQSQNELLIKDAIERQQRAKERKDLPSPVTEDKPGSENVDASRKHKVFISFSFTIEEEAIKLKDQIENQIGPESCWICTSGIRAGDDLDSKISAAIDNAKVVVCAVTQKYADSTECDTEVRLARQQRKKFIPVLMEKVDWPLKKSDGKASPMRMAFAQLLYIPLYKDREENFSRIIEQLKAILGPAKTE